MADARRSSPRRTVLGEFLVVVLLERGDLADTSLMAAAGERRIEESADDFQSPIPRCDPGAECKDVGVVVFARQARGIEIGNRRRAYACDLVGRDRHTDTGSTNQDAGRELAAG